MILLVLLIMVISLIGTVMLIGICAPFSTVNISVVPPKDNTSSNVIDEPFRDDWHFNDNRSSGASSESTGEDAIKSNLRKWIASSSVPTLRSKGMTDEEIKSDLLRDFSITEEQVDEILSAQ